MNAMTRLPWLPSICSIVETVCGMDTKSIPYVVERMTLDDLPAVIAIEQRVFAVPWSAHAFEFELRFNLQAHFVVVRLLEPLVVAGKTVSLLGYGGFWLIVDEAHICTLAVHPDWRGRGLGELLLTHLIGRATELNATFLTLEVRASNLAAQQLYQKYGFRLVDRHERYYSDNHEDAIIMGTDSVSSARFQERFQSLQASLQQKLTQITS